MKRIIKLTESDLARIVKRVISEQDEDDNEDYGTMRGRFFDNDEGDEEWGETDKGEDRLQDLIEEARDILENELGYSIEEINEMSELDMVFILSDEYDYLAYEIEELLDEEGFDTELDEGHDDFITKRRYKDYDSRDYRRIPKDAVRPGKIDFEGTMLSASDDDDDFDEWSLDDDNEEYV